MAYRQRLENLSPGVAQLEEQPTVEYSLRGYRRVIGSIPVAEMVSWCNLVSTLDFESSDPSSNLGETYLFFFLLNIVGVVVNILAFQAGDPGSIPGRCIWHLGLVV